MRLATRGCGILLSGEKHFLTKLTVKKGHQTTQVLDQVLLAQQVLHDGLDDPIIPKDERSIIDDLLREGNKKLAIQMIVNALTAHVDNDADSCRGKNMPLRVSNLRGQVSKTEFEGSIQVADWPAPSPIIITVDNHSTGKYNSHNICHHSKKAFKTAFCINVSTMHKVVEP